MQNEQQKREYLDNLLRDTKALDTDLMKRIGEYENGFGRKSSTGNDILQAIKRGERCTQQHTAKYGEALKFYAMELARASNAGELQEIIPACKVFVAILKDHAKLNNNCIAMHNIANGCNETNQSDGIKLPNWMNESAANSFVQGSTLVPTWIKQETATRYPDRDVPTNAANVSRDASIPIEDLIDSTIVKEQEKIISDIEMQSKYQPILAQYNTAKARFTNLEKKDKKLNDEEVTASEKRAINQFLAAIKSGEELEIADGRTISDNYHGFPPAFQQDAALILKLRNTLNLEAGHVITQALATADNEPSAVSWLGSNDAVGFFTGGANAYFTTETRALVDREVKSRINVEPTLDNIIEQMKAGRSNAAQMAINAYLEGSEGATLKTSLTNLIGEEKTKEFIAFFLKRYNETRAAIIHTEIAASELNYLSIMEQHARFFKKEGYEDILRLTAGIKDSINETLNLSVVSVLNPLSDNYAQKQMLTMQESWGRIIIESGVTEIDKDTIQTSNKDVTITKNNDGIIAQVKTPSYGNLEDTVKLLKPYCEQINEKVIVVNLDTPNGIKIIARLLEKEGLDFSLGKKARKCLEESSEPWAKEFLGQRELHVKQETIAIQERLKKDDFPELDIQKGALRSANDKLDELITNEEYSGTEQAKANINEYKNFRRELKNDFYAFNLLKAEVSGLLTEKQAIADKVDMAIKSGDFGDEVLYLKNAESKLNVKIDNARNNLANKWKSVSANIGNIDTLKDRFDRQHAVHEASTDINAAAPVTKSPTISPLIFSSQVNQDNHRLADLAARNPPRDANVLPGNNEDKPSSRRPS